MNDDGTKTTLNLWPVLACVAGGIVWYLGVIGWMAFVRWCGR